MNFGCTYKQDERNSRTNKNKTWFVACADGNDLRADDSIHLSSEDKNVSFTAQSAVL